MSNKSHCYADPHFIGSCERCGAPPSAHDGMRCPSCGSGYSWMRNGITGAAPTCRDKWHDKGTADMKSVRQER